ncbi:transposase [Clostridium saccharobutylicum DSM 13864]|uniref:Transposase n=1 Tax=Clostridium saccharobutylicum DSM 13864 TaxID=1345695 RepID=U5MN13_CLOSA|nr:transposase [Clostridium saccharobutylicum DSM 13864]
MISALILQRIFSIPKDDLLIIFLKYSQELRDFCGFLKIPDSSKFTRFKQDFLLDLQSMFDNLVDITEPICQQIDENLASMTIFDTSDIETFVTENNPKYANRIIKQLLAVCLHTLQPILPSNRCISIDIFAMLLNSASLLMASVS